MRVLVIVVGKARDAALAAAAQEYERRATHYWPVSVIEVREEPSRGRTSDEVRAREGTRILAQVPPGATLVACVEGGRAMSSPAFAKWMQSVREGGRDLAIAIGGAFGLGDNVITAASTRLSLAPWTLPHELARVVLAEQLYRAGTIVRGEPYHK
jgi:23S rRNA (pseudouridine1915-N3)-methyltransferase